MPQIREASPDALELRSLDEDAAWIAYRRWGWGVIPNPTTAENREEVQRIRALHQSRLGDWHPKRHPSMQMWASSARRIHLASDPTVAAILELRGSTVTPTKNDRTERRRFRKLDETIWLGDRLWSELGAWPWAAFHAGEIPKRWWEHAVAADTLLEFYTDRAQRGMAVVSLLTEGLN